MPFVEHFDVFFDTADFALTAYYAPIGSSDPPVLVVGIFDRAYAEPIAGIAEDSGPVFSCATAAIPNAAHGDELVINGTTYTVRGVQPDGTGVTTLALEVADPPVSP